MVHQSQNIIWFISIRTSCGSSVSEHHIVNVLVTLRMGQMLHAERLQHHAACRPFVQADITVVTITQCDTYLDCRLQFIDGSGFYIIVYGMSL